MCIFAEWCYECGELGHRVRNCPKLTQSGPKRQPPADQPRPPAAKTKQQAGNAKKPQAGARVFRLEAEEGSEDPHSMVSGRFSVNTLPTKVLFDAGATHSFINPELPSYECAFVYASDQIV